MADVRRIYVEKKDAFAVKAKELQEDLKNYLGMTGIDKRSSSQCRKMQNVFP